MRKSIQIGTSDFKELIKGNNYFVDKSLLIKEFLENGAKIIFITFKNQNIFHLKIFKMELECYYLIYIENMSIC